MSESTERSVKIPVFAGTSDAWTTWEPRFIATTDLKGYSKPLMGDETLTTDSAQIIEFKKKNREAYNGLLLENETRECILLITAAKTAEYPRVTQGMLFWRLIIRSSRRISILSWN